MRIGHRTGATVALALGAILYSPAPDLEEDVHPAPPSVSPETAANADDLPAGLTRADWSQIRRAVQESQYHASRVAKPGEAPALQAPNRRQSYGTTFRREGIEIVPRVPGASWRLGISVTGYGYEGDVRPLEPVEPQALKERVEYRREAVTEWYVNRPEGLEQGFELEEPTSRRGRPLVIAMAVQSDLDVSVSADGASFSDSSGQTHVRYTGLKAWDAEGRPLRSHLGAVGRALHLVVEAQAARFPVTVDPTFIHEAQLFGYGDSIGQAGAEFGWSVSVSGNTAVVGAHLDDTPGGVNAGAAYVFVRAGTSWSEQQRLLATDGTDFDFFGASVSVSVDTVVVGARSDDTPAPDAGSAYVFVRSGTTWTEQQKLLASDGAASDLFGVSVLISGDTVVVGAYADDTPGGVNAGSAYVFVRSGTTWSEQQKLLASDGANDLFGISVWVSGDTAVVGASFDDTPGGVNAGSVYVFVRSGTTWTEQQKLLASDGAAGDFFGSSVSVSGDTVVVGAYVDDTPGGVNAGSAYVFVRSGTTWTEEQKLLASDGAANDLFGYSVSVSGDTAAVGAHLNDTPAGPDAGSAYVFVRSGTTWTEQQKLLPSDGTAGDNFGYPVSVSGDTVVVGTSEDDTPGGMDAGSAYVFVRSGTTWIEQQKLLAPDGAATDRFGTSVSISGDTAVVGAIFDDTPGGVDAGSVHVFRVQADLGVTKTNGQTTAVPGLPLTYTITVSSVGPSDVTGATVTDVLPSALLAATWTCVASAGSSCTAGGSGNINDTINLLAGGTATYIVTGTVDPAATGTLVNTATVANPSGVSDPEPDNNSATDTDTLTPEADLAITKTDGQTTAIPGQPLTYTIAASNSGPSNAPVAVVADDFSSVLLGVTWTCVGTGGATCAASGAGDISTLVNLPVGGTVTFTATGTLDPSATGILLNNASVALFPGVTDPNPDNNNATDLDTLEPQADLAITKTDGQATAIPGQTIVYTIVASNSGPSNATNATVIDAFPAAVTGVSWTCVSAGGANCAPSGSGNINALVFLPAGGSVTFTASGTIDPAATGTLSNTATVAAPGGVTDPNPANNSATDTDTLMPEADLGITKTDGQTTAVPGQTVTYTIVASNAGPSDAPGANVTDTFPTVLAGVAWTCVAAGGASCTAGGAGNINDVVSLPVGGTATYTATGTVSSGAIGTLSNTASVTAPGGVTDPDPANNTANDTDVLTPEADLVMGKTDSADPVSPGDPLTYTLTVTNAGPSDATAVAVLDTLPGGVTFVSSVPGPPICTIGGATLTCGLGSLASGGNAAVTVDVTVNDPQGPGVLVNAATVSASEPDPDPANNSDSESTTVSGAKAELGHGFDALYDLGAQPGPAPANHVFLISQDPFSSYEVVVDSTSGDIGVGAGPVLERVGADGTTVLQASSAMGTGPSRSLRWRNATSSTVQDETIRVRSAQCGTDCGPDDVYRVRAYETTYSVPRFNNSGTQITVLILQNPTNDTITGEAYFLIPSGALVGVHAFTVNPKATLVLNTTTVPGANGVSGAVTVAHDGRYGDLAGKTVALEPATGFSFDSALAPRPRNAFR